MNKACPPPKRVGVGSGSGEHSITTSTQASDGKIPKVWPGHCQPGGFFHSLSRCLIPLLGQEGRVEDWRTERKPWDSAVRPRQAPHKPLAVAAPPAAGRPGLASEEEYPDEHLDPSSPSLQEETVHGGQRAGGVWGQPRPRPADTHGNRDDPTHTLPARSCRSPATLTRARQGGDNQARGTQTTTHLSESRDTRFSSGH